MGEIRKMQLFVTQLRVRHYELDTLGHVNNAVYLNYFEQAAIEHSEHLGLTLERYQELGGAFVLRRMEVDYLRSALAGDVLEITTWLQELRGPRAVRRYELRRQDESDLLVTAEALWVWVERATMRPRAIPADLVSQFQSNLVSAPEPAP